MVFQSLWLKHSQYSGGNISITLAKTILNTLAMTLPLLWWKYSYHSGEYFQYSGVNNSISPVTTILITLETTLPILWW